MSERQIGCSRGKKSDRQSGDRYGANDNHDDGNDHRDDGTIDEKSGHGLVLSRFCRENGGFDGRAFADFLNAFDDDHLAGLYAAIDNPLRADTLADFDHTDVHLVVAADDGELVGALYFNDRALRHEKGVGARIGGGADAAELAGPQNIPGVGKRGSDANAASGDVDLTISVENMALLGISRSVRKN